MKLFLIDAYALIYRSYYAFVRNPRINSKGFNTSAVFGFVNSLEDILTREKPTHIAVAFDPKGKTFRHEMYPLYKAQREKTPEDIHLSVPIIKDIIDAYGIARLEVEGYEADDVIGTVANAAAKKNIETYMVTPDKDYAQLVQDHVYLYKPKNGISGYETLEVKDVLEKYKLTDTLQIIDYLALMGDKADNIPGCPSVGEKTAQKLLAQFGTISNLILHTDQLKGSLKKKVEENIEQIKFSQTLVRIKTDVPVSLDFDNWAIKKHDDKKLIEIYQQLEFRKFVNLITQKESKSQKNEISQPQILDLFSTNDTEEKKKSILTDLKQTPHTYQLIDNEIDANILAFNLSAYKIISFDTETDGLDPLLANLVGISFSVEENKAFYVTISPDKEKACKILKIFKGILENKQIMKIGQNIKFDILAIRKYDIKVAGPLFDTMIAHYLLNPELHHGMDFLAETYLGYKPVPIEELIGAKGKNQGNMRDVPLDLIKEYAAEDADVTLKLYHYFEPQLEKRELMKLFQDIEMPLVYALAEMEATGVTLDIKSLKDSSITMKKKMLEIQECIFEMAGETFNINSPQQVGTILFDKLKITEKAKKTKTGKYSTSETVLIKLKDKHPIIEKILEYRGYKKLISTYIDALPKLINPVTHRIHTSYNQAVTATGRLSSTNPNLQNIPIREEMGKHIRKAFTAQNENCIFFSADYSQIELRLMAHLSQDKNMILAFREGKDIHAATAAKIYNIALEDVTQSMRSKAKTANFGIIYGITAFGLSERLNISRKEAKELIDGYFNTYKDVRKYMDKCIETAKSKNYVETLFKRRRYLPDINSTNGIIRGYAERNAINAPIQGTAADIIKIAMVKIHQQIEKEHLRSRMILQVHDELNFNVYKEELSRIKEIVIQEMEHAVELDIPLIADCGTGLNWLEAH